MGIAFVGKSQATSAANSVISLDVAKPAGVVAGTHMTATLTMTGTQTVVTPPAGWTEVHHGTDASCNLYVWQKIAGASEPASYTFSWGASGGGICTIVARSGVDPVTPVVAGESGIAPTNGGSHQALRTTPTIVTAGQRAIVTAFANPYGYGWTGATDTERYNLQRTSAASLLVQDAAAVAAGAISRSASTSGGDVGSGVQSIIALNPYVVPADAGEDQTVPEGTTISLSSTGPGTPAWTQDSGPAATITGANTADPTITNPTAGHYVFRVTYDGGSTDTVNVYVTTDTSTPESILSNAGGWTTNAGSSTGADLVAALADSDDATFIQSPDNPAGNVLEVQAQPLKPGQVQVPYTVSQDVATPQRTCKVELLMGATVIASKTETLTTTPTDGSFTLTPAQLSALTDRVTDLRFRFTAS